MKILVTGGHVTPALAVIDELKGHEIVFVGRKYAVTGEISPSFEYQEVTKRGIKFTDLKAGRLTRLLSLQLIPNLFRIIKGKSSAKKILNQEKPGAVLSFGGYIAYPVAKSAANLGIPVYTHEQTINPGISNKLIGKFAKKVFVSFPETTVFFPKNKVIVTGNPLREAIFKTGKKLAEFEKSLPTIFISGGSLGSHSINRHIKNILPKLLEKYQVIHQTGSVKGEDDFENLSRFRESLPENLKRRYFLRQHFFEDEFGFIYSMADLVVGRSGANTFFELIAVEKPAVFIPLPWSSGKEQQKQAQIFAQAGAGEVFDQSEESETLKSKIDNVLGNLEQYKNSFKNLKQYQKDNAAKLIAHEVSKNS